MKEALIEKFKTNKDLLQKLLNTKGKEIIYNSLTDKYWGYASGAGANKLGLFLMETRELLSKS